MQKSELNPINGIVIKAKAYNQITPQDKKELIKILQDNPELKMFVYDETLTEHIMREVSNEAAIKLLSSTTTNIDANSLTPFPGFTSTTIPLSDEKEKRERVVPQRATSKTGENLAQTFEGVGGAFSKLPMVSSTPIIDNGNNIFFKNLTTTLQSSCGTLDAPLFVRAIQQSGIDINNISFSKEKRAISLGILTEQQKNSLLINLKTAQQESITSRVFKVENLSDGTITIPTSKFNVSATHTQLFKRPK